MKNWEKYEDEIKKYGIDNVSVTKKGVMLECHKIDNCENCIFFDTDCDKNKREIAHWLYRDYKDLTLLTDSEKEYLENVLRPFKNEDIKITKKYKEGLAHIFIEIGNCDGTISFPNFVAGARYNNIAFNICYTSKDLGLFEGED